ncbi:hypothetical protein B566_EDAN002106 [Ephemera danica]|nr:hypothetical protein B566_EDAN002106 [Ephemera danica]
MPGLQGSDDTGEGLGVLESGMAPTPGEEDGPEQSSNKLLGIPFVEEPQHRLDWVAHLEFSHNAEGRSAAQLTWDALEVRLPRTDRLRTMVRAGIPHSLRPQLWMRLSGALQKKLGSETSYREVVKASSSDALVTSKQIEKDLLRTMPSNACFSRKDSTGVARLRRVLRGLAWLYPDIGYSSLLLLLEEEDAFWMIYLPDVDAALREHDIELALISSNWFLTLFASVVHMKVLLRVWDLMFFDGSITLFQVTLGMLRIREPSLKALENSAQIFNALSDIPGDIEDVEQLLQNDGFRRQVRRSKSVLQLLLFGDEAGGEDDARSKNVRQTELLVDLREAVLQVARHFTALDPRLARLPLQRICSAYKNPNQMNDFSYFERHDDDELGFRKNDVITILSQKDEHCWVGELNGLQGWFPAKFVELLDERSKQYSSAGDDAVSEAVTDLVRGTLCPAVKQILEHGMRRPNFLGGVCHPWLFVEEAAKREVERDYNSVYSRLVLCKTYRLDEDGKVLTPEELLYRCVQAVNLSHDEAHAQMDVKLRSLVCLGLNEQALHLWLEVLCSSVEVVNKWYYPWSFVCSPGWVQIKCELRVLSQFAFNLNPDWELPAARREQSQPLKDGVRDMLVKHHLFSWDL